MLTMRKRTKCASFLLGGVLLAALANPYGEALAPPSEVAAGGGFVAVDRSADAGLAAVSKTFSASVVDYDRDGDEDVLIGYHANGSKLWENIGRGTYQRVAPTAWPKFNARGKQIDRHDCAWGDVDRNGRPDAYCSTGRFTKNAVKYDRDNELWLQSPRGEFRDVGTKWGMGDVCGRGRHVVFLFANGDKYPDLFLGNESPRDVEDPCNEPANGLPNERSKLFINTGGTGFRYDRRFWPYAAGPGTWCAEKMDFDDDGWDDLLTCGSDDHLGLYRNRSGQRLADVTAAHDLNPPVTDAVVADIDGDLDRDIVTANLRGFAYHLNNNGRFGTREWVGFPPDGQGRSVAVGDADGDGDLDVYGMVASTPGSNPDDVIWLNDNMNFSPITVPSATGTADDVVALHPRERARAEYLVLNGGFGRADTVGGPIQLIRVIASATG